MENSNYYRVYKKGKYPKPKREFYKAEFKKRQQARNFCRNRCYVDGLVIVHPNRAEEPYLFRGY